MGENSVFTFTISVTMRTKQKKVEDENTFLKMKVTEFENNLKIGESKLNDLAHEYNEMKENYDLDEIRLSQLKKRLKSQSKLEDLAKGPELANSEH